MTQPPPDRTPLEPPRPDTDHPGHGAPVAADPDPSATVPPEDRGAGGDGPRDGGGSSYGPSAPRWLARVCRRSRESGFRRRSDDRWAAGVCAGVADRLGVDPLVVRLGVVVLALVGGAGVAAYLVALCLMVDTHDAIPLEQALRHGDAGSMALVGVTALVLLSGSGLGVSGHGWGQLTGLAWLVCAAAALWWWRSQGSPRPWRRRRAERLAARTRPTHENQPGHETRPGLQTGTGHQTRPEHEAWAGREDGDPGHPAARPRRGSSYRPVTVRRATLGTAGALTTVGLATVGAAAVVAATRTGRLHVDHVAVVALAVALAVCAGFLVVVGLAGRRGGFTTPVVVALAALTLGIGGVGDLDAHGDWSLISTGDRTWIPTTVAAGTAYRLGAGDGVLDLTHLDAASRDGRTVHVHVGTGDLTVRVPQGTTVRVEAHVGLGDVRERRADGSATSLDHGTTTIGSGTPALVVDAHLGLGDLTIEEVAR